MLKKHCFLWAAVTALTINAAQADDDKKQPAYQGWDLEAQFNILTNMTTSEISAVKDQYEFSFEGEIEYGGGFQIVSFYKYNFVENISAYAGYEGEKEEDEPSENYAIIGLTYELPYNIEADVRLNHEGHVKFLLSGEFEIAENLELEIEVDTDKEYEITLEYEITDRISIVAGHDSEFGTGIGFGFKF